MGKYDPLRDYLAKLMQAGPVTLSFADIERLVSGLPNSARIHRTWWANDSKSEARAWRAAGWHVESVSLTAERVVFVRGVVGGIRLGQSATPPTPQLTPSSEGRTEASVQGQLVAYLRDNGWTILRQADTATRERGIDVVATRNAVTLACEVKGYPSRSYADPRRAGEVKPTSPSVQARHWYAGAVLTAMLTRQDHAEYRVVIALPDAGTYRSLHRRTQANLAVIGIEVWFVGEDGSVEGPTEASC